MLTQLRATAAGGSQGKELGSIPLAAWGCVLLLHQLTAKQTLIVVFTFHAFSYKERSFPNLFQFGKNRITSGLLQKGSGVK